MQVRLLVGPAGSGKTFRCLQEAQQSLSESPNGPPLVLVAPKQGTYQLEQQLLSSPSIPGYTRLHILSFEALGQFVFEQLREERPRMLDEEGRLMVLRSLLAKNRSTLKLFRASARLTGFAQQLSQVLRELQRNNLTPGALNCLAPQVLHAGALSHKLEDLSTLLGEYMRWLKAHNLQDDDCLLVAAAEALRAGAVPYGQSAKASPDLIQQELFDQLRPAQIARFRIAKLWVDGFAQFSDPELDFLTELTRFCDEMAVTFCMEEVPSKDFSWLSPWSTVGRAFKQCEKRFRAVASVNIMSLRLPRNSETVRFSGNPVLQHLERSWAEPQPYQASMVAATDSDLKSEVGKHLRLACCVDPEGEATLAAREILGYVRVGGRFRDISILVRGLETYHRPLTRVLSRYDIPFFLDRREPIAHHPLAELTRSALRTVALGWRHEDWFAALKSGLIPAGEMQLDRLENEALARGWRGETWHQPIRLNSVKGTPEELERLNRLESDLEALRRQIIGPFEKFALTLAVSDHKPTGSKLAEAIRTLWQDLNVQQQLENWADTEPLSYESRVRGSIHPTVWNEMDSWLDNLELAFPVEALPLREWLPILEAGLAGLTVGAIPPALDQVLIGAIDRSRTPEIKLALVLGLNETVFPALPQSSVLLTETDRLELEKRNVLLTSSFRPQLGYERYLAYIACTRARERTVLTCALNDANGTPLNPSPFLSHIKGLFPSLTLELVPKLLDWRDSEHVSELVAPLLTQPAAVSRLAELPGAVAIVDRFRDFHLPDLNEALSPELAAQLYKPVLRSSVSRLEQFATCPFKFFVHSGLRAQERERFELDVKEQGSFQHDVLAAFHQHLAVEKKKWRDITPKEARDKIAKIARAMLATYRHGLLDATAETRFMARILTESLQDFVYTLVEWMRDQYRFDPVMVELPFGEDENSPPWEVDLNNKFCLELYGRIDRIDLYREPGCDYALCVVVDYKSSQKQLDPVLIAHGLQLQLLTYLNVLRHWPNPRACFGVDRLIPAGVFYVNLRGKYTRASNRLEALSATDSDRKSAYRHSGRFDLRALPHLDSRAGVKEGDQFNFRLTQRGKINKGCREPLPTAEFKAMLDGVESTLRTMGQQIYAGQADVAPFRRGRTTACAQCGYQSICRIDPWTHSYRLLNSIGRPTP